MTLTLLQSVQILAFVCSLATLSSTRFRHIRPLFYIMLVTVLAESVGYYVGYIMRVKNHSIYNISVPTIILLLLFFVLQKH